MSKMDKEEENSSKISKKKFPELELANNDENPENEDAEDESSFPIASKEFDYLISMSLWALSQEKVNTLLNQKEQKKNEIMLLEKMRIEDIWVNDMEEFLTCLDVNINK